MKHNAAGGFFTKPLKRKNEMIDNQQRTPETAPKPPANGENQGRPDVTRITFQVLSIGVLISAVVWILRPFLISIIWAGMIVVTTWPILLKLEARLKNKRGLAVAVMTLGLLMVLIVPLLSAIGVIIQRSDDIYVWLQSLRTFTVPPPPTWLSTIPLVGPRLFEYWQPYTDLGMKGLGTYLAPYSMKAATWFLNQAGTVGMMVIQFLLTVIIAAMLYAKGETVSTWFCRFARRLAGQQGEAVTILAAKAVRGVALGVVVTAALQAMVAGLGLIVTGVPAAVLLTAVMLVLSLAQIGPVPVLIPAVIWVYWQYGVLWGTILVVFSILAVILDNFVRPFLIRKGADLPLVLILFGVIGGLIAFGVMGLFIGPVVLVVAHTLLTAWVLEESAGETVFNEEE
jgi:predicted PurR-regulated permease PerM